MFRIIKVTKNEIKTNGDEDGGLVDYILAVSREEYSFIQTIRGIKYIRRIFAKN